MKRLSFLVLVFSILFIPSIYSQNPKLDRDKLYIGDKFTYTFKIDNFNKDEVLKERLTSNEDYEIISKDIDTIKEDNKEYIEVKYNLVSFSEGIHSLYDIDSNKLDIEVMSFPIDTTKIEIKDIKANAKEPYTFREILPVILLVILIIGLLVLSYYLYKYWKKNNKKGIKEIFSKPQIQLPAHIIAIEALERLRKERLCERGENKRYYSLISDILRQYISDRFSIAAMEMTSNEIFSSVENINEIDSSNRLILESILNKSDLVKFAKLIPDSFTDDKVIKDSLEFVNNTKKEENDELKKEVEDVK
ncbi:MAG: hypothetical protein ACK5MH_08685 [Bacteroidales bacterium]